VGVILSPQEREYHAPPLYESLENEFALGEVFNTLFHIKGASVGWDFLAE
jgi:hypothetical protein